MSRPADWKVPAKRHRMGLEVVEPGAGILDDGEATCTAICTCGFRSKTYAGRAAAKNGRAAMKAHAAAVKDKAPLR